MGVAAPVKRRLGAETTGRRFGPDPFLLAIIVPILAIGIVVVTSAGYILASGKYGDGFYFTKKQGFAMVIGLGLMFACSMVNPEVWKRLAGRLLVVGFVMLGLVFVPGLGVEMGGSHRWVRLPFGMFVQPSEIMKLVLVIFTAYSLDKKGAAIRELAVGFIPHVLVTGLAVTLVLLQPDFGNAVIMAVVGFLMLFAAGVRVRHLLGGAILFLPFIFQVAISANYRVLRLKTFLDPWSDPLKSGFQIIQSLIAFGCGGIWGVGIGKGIQKLYYLPQPHTDFVFSMVGEELGLFGVLILILLFSLIVCRGFMIAIRAEDGFHRLLAFGLSSLIGLQAMVNMAVSMGLLPTKGLPLPLVSMGGTSMVVTLVALGILMSVAGAVEAKSPGGKP